MAKFGRIVLLIVLTGVMVAGIFFLRQRIFGGTEKAQLKVDATVLSDEHQCQVDVTIDRPQNDVDLEVTVTAKTGIRFIKGTEGVPSVTREVGTVFPREERILTFNCFLDGTRTLHSGAYMVQAVANHRNPKALEGRVYATGKTALYVEYVGLTVEPSEPKNIFLADKEAFDRLFTEPYEQGAYYQYKLDLAPEETRPISGLLHVRINSETDDFAPALYVVVSGGVAFQEPLFPGFVHVADASLARIQASDIDAGGSRIVSIPFTLAKDAIPGSYGIKVLQAGQGQQPGEMAPLYISVTTSPDAPGQQWLTPDKRDDAPLLTPAPTRK